MEGTAEGRYLLEIDGVSSIRASEVTMPGKEHTPVELYVGNQRNPILVSGNFKVDALTFKHAHALNQSGEELFRWIDGYLDGVDQTKRGARFIIMDEGGSSPLEEYELQECVPTSFKPETHSASGTNASMFTFGLRPSNMRRL
ncbi:MAG TPA: phage tail protein [Pyrinomonadaceae bacterium]|nr:phage tail protein [Pyrinomonadaceae bacterium]